MFFSDATDIARLSVSSKDLDNIVIPFPTATEVGVHIFLHNL